MTATLSTEPAANRDGSVVWLAHGIAGGIPYVADGDSEEGAIAAACELVYQRHAARKYGRIAVERGAHR